MSNLQLSQSLNRNKVFLLNKNQLEDVWNVEFYKPEFIKNRENLKRNKYGLVKLQSITSKITKGETPLWRGDGYLKQGIIFVKSENVLENELNINDTDFIAEEVHSRMKRSQLKKGDVLFNIVGASIGRACVYDKDDDANINQAICLIRLNDGLNPYWLSSLLNSTPYKTWINQLKSGGARDNIDLGQANSFLIPNHPKEVQEKIISISRKAADQKKQNEAAAEKLLASIDDYLLKELGISLIKINADKYGMFSLKQTELKYKLFYTNKNFSLKRLDTHYYMPIYETIKKAMSNGKYKLQKIKDITTEIKSGSAPKVFYETGNHYLKVRNIKDLDINWDTDKVHNDELKEDYLLSTGDIVMVTMGAGSLGKCSIFNEDIICQYDPKITKIKCIDTIDNYYMLYLFHSQMVQKLLEREVRGSTGMTMINPTDFSNIEIPIPPLDKQKEIADHITAIRQQAQLLKEKTKEALYKASQEIEKILLA